jgi:Rad52/22 family double-strand break repair protein
MPAETTAPRDPHLIALTAALAEPFEPREVKFKPQSVKNNRCLAMAYIDARLIQDRLDEVLGVENWTDSYTILNDGSVMCRLRLKLGDRWITKTDVGSPSEQPDGGDRLKAAFSDALKRAAVKFGIGRYLYRLPAQWVDYDGMKKQIVSPPQLPAWALPKARRVEVVKTPPRGGAVLTTGAPAPQVEAPKVASAAEAKPNLPANGTELHRRLQDYDAKLASQKLCSRGALLAHVTQAGVKAGFTANLTDWTGPAIPFAVDAVKEFEKGLRTEKPEPRTAA